MAEHKWEKGDAVWVLVQRPNGWLPGEITAAPPGEPYAIGASGELEWFVPLDRLRPRDLSKHGKDKPTAESEAQR